MKRYDILKHLITTYGYNSYLEVGVRKGDTFNRIPVKDKVGVDPKSRLRGVVQTTSDVFFTYSTRTFDLIFIDGLHEHQQVYRDVCNSLDCLNPGGCIVCHDLNPQSEKSQVSPRVKGCKHWNGDCWKAWVQLRCERSDIEMAVVDTDEGCGIIRRGQTRLHIEEPELTYGALVQNRVEWLNLISVEEFHRGFFKPNL